MGQTPVHFCVYFSTFYGTLSVYISRVPKTSLYSHLFPWGMVNERGPADIYWTHDDSDANMRLEERLYLAFESLIFQKQGLKTSSLHSSAID